MYEHRDDIGPNSPSGAPPRRRRLLLLGLMCAVVVALLAFLIGEVLGDNGDEKARTASPSTTLSPTTTGPSAQVQAGATSPLEPAPPTSEGSGVGTPVTGSTARLAAATTTTAKAAPAAAPPPCQNSHDPKCGPFKWVPDPGPNAALTASISCTEPEACPKPQEINGTAGQSVAFRI